MRAAATSARGSMIEIMPSMKAHDDDHGVGYERDQIARPDDARVDVATAHPHDADRRRVHDEHHGGHHERHDRLVNSCVRISRLEASSKRASSTSSRSNARDRHARQHLARHEIHPVGEGLHDLELRHGDLEQDEHDAEHGEHRRRHDPPHRRVGRHDHDDAPSARMGA